MTATIDLTGPRAALRFTAPYDLDSYAAFLRAKRLPESELTYDWRADSYTLTTPARFAGLLGEGGEAAETGPAPPLAPHLFDYQAAIVTMALAAERFAAWLDTGLGKTAIQLEWARQVMLATGGRVLILAPLAIIPQTITEAARFYRQDLPIERLDSRERLGEWCTDSLPAIGICNYEKFIPGVLPQLRDLTGLVADESSLLKSGGGTIKWNLIKSARGIRYKLSCTATPAPNDTMEYASQASFLEKLRSEGDILWTYFSRDKRGNWRVKPHATEAFYRFMASWSIYLRDPAHYGWADILSTLPPPVYHEERLPLTDEQQAEMHGLQVRHGTGMFGHERMGVKQRTKFSQLAKGFLYGAGGKVERRIPSVKPARVAEIARAEVAAGRPCIIWTVFDEEAAIVAEHLDGVRFVALSGDMSEADRAAAVAGFLDGSYDLLLTKSQLAGFGLNLQRCRAMVFSGFDDSFERMYHAIRRAYRFGQTETVHVWVPYIAELEGMMFENIREKERKFMADVAEQERHYIAAMAGEGG